MVDDDVATLTRLMVAAGVVILFVAPLERLLAGRPGHAAAGADHHARPRGCGPATWKSGCRFAARGDELDQLSLTINRFLDLIADYLERNREFVANAAHELRSPLAAMQSSVEVTLNTDRTVDEYQDLLGEIADECGQLRVLVNQLLLLAESDAARLPVEQRPVRFDRLVRKVGRHVPRGGRGARHSSWSPMCADERHRARATATGCGRWSTT